MQGLQGRDFVICLEAGGAAAHNHFLYGVLSDHNEFAPVRNAEWQHAVILQQHSASGGDFARCGVVLGRIEAAEVGLACH